jgi:hypothetical protein
MTSWRPARIADAAGIARWRGYGGRVNNAAWSFETMTHGAALAAHTSQIPVRRPAALLRLQSGRRHRGI